MLIIYTNFTVETERFGKLKFSTVTVDSLAKNVEAPTKTNDARESFIHILSCYLLEPKISEEDMVSLPDFVLESIGRELLKKSYLSDRLDETTTKEKGFFTSFSETYKKLIAEQKKSLDKWAMLSTINFQRAIKDADMYLKGYSMIDEVAYSKRLFSGFHGMYETALKEMERVSREKAESLWSLAQPWSEKIQGLAASLRMSLPDITSIEKHLPSYNAISSANVAIADMMDHRKYTDEIAIFKARELAAMGAVFKDPVLPEIARMSQYATIGEISLAAQKTMAEVQFRNMSSFLQISSTRLDSLENSFGGFADSYAALYRSIEEKKIDIASLDWFVTELPPVEIYTSADLARIISRPAPTEVEPEFPFAPALVEDIEESLEGMLAKMEPSLLRTWRGARQALKSDNPDRFRHVTVSLRELLTHVLHKIAPEDDVKKWTSEPEHFHKGHPTRAARLLFVCRSVNCGPFTAFVRKDVESHTSFLELFQRGTHELEISFSEEQIELLIVRTEALLRFLLTVSKNN